MERSDLFQRPSLPTQHGTKTPVPQPNWAPYDPFTHPSQTGPTSTCQTLSSHDKISDTGMESFDESESICQQIKMELRHRLEGTDDGETPRYLPCSGPGQHTAPLNPPDSAVDFSCSPIKVPLSRCRSRDSTLAPALQSSKGNKNPNRKPRVKKDGMESKEAHALSEFVRRAQTNGLTELGCKAVPPWFMELVNESQWDIAHSTNHSNEISKNTLIFGWTSWTHYQDIKISLLQLYRSVPHKIPTIARLVIDEIGRQDAMRTRIIVLEKERETRDNRFGNGSELATEIPGRSDGKPTENENKKQTGLRGGSGQKRKSSKL